MTFFFWEGGFFSKQLSVPSSYLFQGISGHCFLFLWMVCDVNVGCLCRPDAMGTAV